MTAKAVLQCGRGAFQLTARLVFHLRPHPVVQGFDAVPGQLGIGPRLLGRLADLGVLDLDQGTGRQVASQGGTEAFDLRQHESRLVFGLQLHAAIHFEGHHCLGLLARGDPRNAHDHQAGRVAQRLVADLGSRRNLLFADLDGLLRPLDRRHHVTDDRPARPARRGDHNAGLPLVRLGGARFRTTRIAFLELGESG